MWQEYAVQPECLVQSRDAFRVLFSSLGWEHGRLLAKYPAKGWFRTVHEALDRAALQPVARKWIEERLAEERDSKQRTVSVRKDYDPKLDWLINAEKQQLKGNKFHAVVALANPRQRDDVLVGEELTDQTPLWRCEGTRAIPRTSAAISEAVAPLLERAENILIIDPHFGRAGRSDSRYLDRRFLDVLGALLERIPFAERALCKKQIRVEYHLNAANLVLDVAEFERRTVRDVGYLIPPSANIDFLIWRQRVAGEKLHDRFVLTELGGVMVSVGLDAGEPGETTALTRISRTLHEKTWENYQKPTAAFKLEYKFSVEG